MTHPALTQICSWCGVVLHVDLTTIPEKRISHGICIDCLPKFLGPDLTHEYRQRHTHDHEEAAHAS